MSEADLEEQVEEVVNAAHLGGASLDEIEGVLEDQLRRVRRLQGAEA